jgi:uncharacterized protein with GYD domain
MPKYLWQASYNSEGVKGVVTDGGSGRRDAIETLVTGAGGTLEAFYFSFGESDVVVIADLPDEETATAIALTVNGGGLVSLKTTVLLTPEEVDAAVKKSVDYRPPGA